MKINRNGITFDYHGDQLLWMWPWRRHKDKTRRQSKYYSYATDDYFCDLAEYWRFVGVWNEACRKRKIIGYSEYDVFIAWAKQSFRFNTAVVMRHVNVEVKSTWFWKSLDQISRKELQKDLPILFFYDLPSALKVAHSIEPEFAEVYLFDKGRLKYTNTENEIDPEPEPNQNTGNWTGR